MTARHHVSPSAGNPDSDFLRPLAPAVAAQGVHVPGSFIALQRDHHSRPAHGAVMSESPRPSVCHAPDACAVLASTGLHTDPRQSAPIRGVPHPSAPLHLRVRNRAEPRGSLPRGSRLTTRMATSIATSPSRFAPKAPASAPLGETAMNRPSDRPPRVAHSPSGPEPLILAARRGTLAPPNKATEYGNNKATRVASFLPYYQQASA